MLLTLFGFAMIEVMPDILDYYLPLNESQRMHYLPAMNEYRYQETYFYPLFLYVMVSIIIGILTLMSVGWMLFSIVLHCCTIFKISR